MSQGERMHRHFDDELKLLKERLLTMGSLAEKALHRAVDALAKHDGAMLNEVFELEKETNDLEVQVEQDVLSLIARRQPVAAEQDRARAGRGRHCASSGRRRWSSPRRMW